MQVKNKTTTAPCIHCGKSRLVHKAGTLYCPTSGSLGGNRTFTSTTYQAKIVENEVPANAMGNSSSSDGHIATIDPPLSKTPLKRFSAINKKKKNGNKVGDKNGI